MSESAYQHHHDTARTSGKDEPDPLVRDHLPIGVIGCGDFATRIIWPSLRYAPVEIIYACARTEVHAERNRRLFGAQVATTKVDHVLGDSSVEAVFIIGPPAMHYELGTRALEAGKHVFMEKPPGSDLTHAQRLHTTSQSADVQCQVAFQKRFAPTYLRVRDQLSQGDFGDAPLLRINYSHWRIPTWREHLTNMSIHAIDLSRFFLGDPSVGSVLKRTAGNGTSICVLTMLHESGAAAVLNLSANAPHVQEWIEVAGENKMVSVHNLTDYRNWVSGADVTSTEATWADAYSGWRPEFTIPYRQSDSLRIQGYAGEVVAFVGSVLNDVPVAPSIADAVAAMRLIRAIENAPDGVTQLDLEAG